MNIFSSNSLLDMLSTDNSISKRDSIAFSNNEIENFFEVFNNVNKQNQDTNISKHLLDFEGCNLEEDDVVIVDLSSDDCKELVSLVKKIQSALEENSEIRNNLINVIEESTSLDELEEKMALLAAEFNMNIKSPVEILPNGESSYIDLENIDVSHIFNNNSFELSDDNVKGNSTFLNEEIIENFIGLLEHADSFEEAIDVSKILKKLQRLIQSNENVRSNIADKKKDVILTFDNLNTNVIHNKIMNIATPLAVSDTIDYSSNTFMNNLVNIINNKIMNSDLSKETLEVRLKLYPSNLGTLVVDIAQVDDKISLKVVTESTNVKNFLLESIKDLVNSLNANNIDVGDVSVFVGNGSQSSSNGQSNQQSFNSMTLNYDNDKDINDNSITKFKGISTSRNLDIHI